jgi:two-component system OmpR family response regulator
MRVLVIEDEPDLLSVIMQSLRESGYAVDGASDGREGLFKARSADYDALVLDLMLPGIDGWSLLRELRKTHPVPVLLLTARDSLPDRVRGLDAGADDYLTKPFELAELLARLRALIRRSAGKASSLITFGDITLDTSTRTAMRSGEMISLTPREYSLVEFLAMHKGKLVTRTMIYDHLFDEENDTLSNLVDVHVSNVRRKLGKEFITTRRGEGYFIHA